MAKSAANEDAEQSAVVDLLGAPETHGGEEVERVDTHISHLFLAGSRVYKLKRAVRTNFLDFSTPERRRAVCERELEVNAAAAGTLYRGVVPVVRRDGTLHLGGEGEPVDWVVEMERFDRDTEFDRMAERGELSLRLVEDLADAVARMHCDAPTTPEYGGADAVLATIRQIAEAIGSSPMADRLADALTRWQEQAESACHDRAAQLDARRRHGFVRRCHGDLHLGNICLVAGRPTPFDALEFNEEMASIDVLYDVAFTIMDLLERGLRLEANAFVGRYLGFTRDYSGLALLPLFVSMRAAVRCLVAASRETPEPGEPPADERLDFALQSLAAGGRARLVAVGGLSGSGKSTLARHVAPELGGGVGAVVLRSDVIRKRLFGVVPEEALPPEAYRPGTSERVYLRMRRDAGRALRAGAPVIMDAAFLETGDRRHAEDTAAQCRVPFTGLWMACDADELRRRVAGRTGDASDADLSVLEKQLERTRPPEAWASVDAGGDLAGTLDEARAALGLASGSNTPRN